jgi:adenosylmethionine-8-amino-7-oxononanoate aminotransferase
MVRLTGGGNLESFYGCHAVCATQVNKIRRVLRQSGPGISIQRQFRTPTFMGNVFYRNPQHEYPEAAGGEGVYLYDSHGRQYLDGSGGAAVSCLGHGHPEVIAAIRKQLEGLAFAHTAFFTNRPQEQLAERLVRLFGEADARVYFLTGGSEANEAALKLARQYWLARGREKKHMVVSRRQSYHGNTLGALSMTGHLKRRAPYLPMLQDWPRIGPCYAYRHQRSDEDEIAYGERSAAELEQAIGQQGAENIAAFMAETVVGASLGAVEAAGNYFRKIREVCDRHEILLILDEVMAGCGRTGSFFAFEQEGIVPDIVTLAKGLAGGYQPIGALIARGGIHEEVADRLGAFTHGHTYVGHATACAAALAVTSVIEEGGLVARVRELGGQLEAGLQDAFRDHPNVGDIRGRGLFWGLELVGDRDSKAPVSAALGLPGKVKDAAMANGLICYPGGGTADGSDGAHVLLAPPYICENTHIEELVDKLARTLSQVFRNNPV